MILLPGVHMDDIQAYYLNQARSIINGITQMPEKQLSPIPHFFTTYREWPDRCNVKCAYCDDTVTSKPVFIPVNIEADRIYIKGSFCSFPCAVAYAILDSSLGEKTLHMIYHVYYLFYGQHPLYIPPAPDRLLRTCFGGHLDAIEFKNEIKRCVKNIILQ